MNSVPEIDGRRSVAAAAAADRADGGGQYHGVYVAKDAVAKLAGTLPQRAVVPCFVRGARLRVCVRVSALRVCSAWLSGKRDQTTFGPASAANSWPSARRSRGACAVWAMSHTRASRNFDFGFEVRGERQARVPHVVCVRVWSHAVQRVFCVFCVLCLWLRPRWLPQAVYCACAEGRITARMIRDAQKHDW